MAEPRSTAQEAADPSTSPERLLDLTEKHPQLHRLLALNPSTPEVARQWILATNPWARRAYDEQQAGAAASPDPGTDAAPNPQQGSERDPEMPDPRGSGERRHRTVAAAPAWADLPAESVWGDLRSPSEEPARAQADDATVEHTAVLAAEDRTPSVVPPPAPPLPSPAEDYRRAASPSTGVRIASPDAVVPLGPGPTPAAPRTDQAPPQAPPAGRIQQPGEPGKPDASHRRLWLAGAGCLLLALLLILASVLIGRALLTDDAEEPAAQPTATATEAPSPEPTVEETTPAPDPVSPAPEDAQELSALSSPTGNITCALEADSVACSIVERDFSEADLEDCADGPFTIAVTDGEAAPACGSPALVDSAPTLEYDRSAVHGDMACTSRFDGMTCWNTMTGKGFTVNRAGYETF